MFAKQKHVQNTITITVEFAVNDYRKHIRFISFKRSTSYNDS